MTTTEATLKPYVELRKKGIQKLETFFKIAATKDETAYMEIDPQDNIIRLNCMDPPHVTQTIHIINNENNEDFDIQGLERILQFNINVRDFNKLLSLNEDKDIKIYPDIDEQNRFDMLKIHILENNVNLKQIYLPIHKATGLDLFNETIELVNNLSKSNNSISIIMEIDFLNEILKDAEIFQNERLRWNVTIVDGKVEGLSIETFDIDTDKTRRVKTNLFQGLHFNTKNVNVSDNETHRYNVLFSFSDLKKILVSSKIYSNVNIILKEQNPITIIYNSNSDGFSTVEDTLTSLLAPIIVEQTPEAR